MIVLPPDNDRPQNERAAARYDDSSCEQLRTDVRFLRAAIARLEGLETPLTVRGALLAIICASTSEAWSGAFEHLGQRRLHMRAMLDALDAHYGFRTVSVSLDPDAVRAVSRATAAMVVLPFATALFNALLAIAHERDLVLRLRGGRLPGESPNLRFQSDL